MYLGSHECTKCVSGVLSKGPTSVLKMCIWGPTNALNVYQGSDRCTRCVLGVHGSKNCTRCIPEVQQVYYTDVYLGSNKCTRGVPGSNKYTRCCT